MNKVYGLMSVGMLITGAAAWAVSGLAMSTVPTDYQIGAGRYLTDFGYALYASPIKWLVMLAPLIMVFAFGAVLNRISAAGAQLYFYVYAALIDISLSSIFLVFTGYSIVQTFLITAIAFAGLSLYGYVTKRDLAPMGAFLIMGLIGLIIAGIVNIFLQSSAMSFVLSAIGVLVFTGLTAYDTQKIKEMYLESDSTLVMGQKAIMGALSLYLDFINLFLFLLRFMGNRD